MWKLSLCVYSDAFILFIRNIAVTRDAEPSAGRTDAQLVAARQADERGKGITFKNCAPFINCTNKIKNIQIDNAKDINVVMYYLIKYTDNYSKTSGSLWQYYKDVSDKGDDAAITDSESFKSEVNITGKNPVDDSRKNAEIAVALKYVNIY